MKNNKKMLAYMLALAIGISTVEPSIVYATNRVTVVENSDEKIQSYFASEKELIENYINEENYEFAKKKGKDFFITCVDFIFFDKPIMGVSWNDISDAAKKDVYNTFCNMDYMLTDLDPSYKDKISSKYLAFKTFTNNKYYKFINSIKKEIGEDNYNDLKASKEVVERVYKQESTKVKSKIKKWYINYKN